MELPRDLVKEFAQVTVEDDAKPNESTVPGTTVSYEGQIYVKLDGSDQLTPISTTTTVGPNQRVNVLIKNHTATVTGNYTDPSASNSQVTEIGDQISEFEVVIADKVDTDELNAQIARIDQLVSDNITVNGKIDAAEAEIDDLTAQNATITGNLEAANAEIENLKATKIDADIVEAKYATIENLEATNADIHNLEVDYGSFKDVATDTLEANSAEIDNLKATKLDAEDADILYANIDFANIGEAAIENLFSKSGIIGDLVMSDGHVTGTLVGVTIKGDLIEGGTVVADKLVIQGEDGLYYKLNTTGETVSAEQTDYNSLNGSVITAKSITAEKVAVDDLVAFGATIGGFHITDSALYSGVKTSANNTTRGTFMNDDGEFAVGDGNNYIKFFKDTDGQYKLAISASSIKFGTSGPAIDDAITSTVEEFYQSNSATSLTGGSWSETQPTWTQGKFIWRRTKVTYLNGVIDYTPDQNGVCITGNTGPQGPKGNDGDKGDKGDPGEKGADGSPGANGEDGNGIASHEITYQAGSSQTTQPTGTWSSAIPTLSANLPYLWTQTVITYDDGSTSTSYSVSSTLDSFEIGGINLALRTKDFAEADDFWSIQSLFKRSVDSDGFTILSYSRSSATQSYWNRAIPHKYIYKEDMYRGIVVSFDFMCDDVSVFESESSNGIVCSLQIYASNGTRIGWDESANILTPTDRVVLSKPLADGEWARISIKFTENHLKNVTLDGYTKDDVAYTSVSFQLVRNGSIHFRKVKIEYGNKPTDWSPAPEDMATTSELDSVNQTATNANSNATAAQIAADAANDKIDNLQVGGRNLLLNSGFLFSFDPITLSKNKYGLYSRGGIYKVTRDESTMREDKPSLKIVGSKAGNISGDICWGIVPVANSLQTGTLTGKSIVFSFWAKAQEGSPKLNARLGYETYVSSKAVTLTTSWQRYVIQIADPATDKADREIIFYLDAACTVWLSECKAEFGNIATDWTPAPEDVDQKIDDIEVGGRNLIIGSANGGEDYAPGNGTLVSDGWNGNSAVSTTAAWNGYFIKLAQIIERNNIKIGDTLTASIYVSVDSETEVTTPGLHAFRFDNSSHNFGAKTLKKGEWERLSFSFEVNENQVDTARFEANTTTTYSILWSSPQIEKGNKVTDWTPAPEDMATSEDVTSAKEEVISQISAQLEILPDSIISNVKNEFYTKDEVDESIGAAESTMTQTYNEFRIDFNQYMTDREAFENSTTGTIEEFSRYIRFVDGNIILGEEGNQITLKIENDIMGFYEAGNQVAYLSDNKLYVTDAEIVNRLALGRFAFFPRSNGNLTLRYI